MAMPLRYNLRNLFRRKLRTLLTILGIALVVAIAVVMLAYSRGLLSSLRNNGDADNAVVLSRRATEIGFSSLKESQYDMLSALIMDDVTCWAPEGADEDEEGIDLVAPFVAFADSIRIKGRAGEGHVVRRGIVTGVDVERAPHLHSNLRLKSGRWLNLDDEKTAMVGALAYARLDLRPEDLKEGTVLTFSGADWTIVGTFEAPGTSMESEVWVPVDELTTVLNRPSYTHIVVKAPTREALTGIVDLVNRSDQVELRAVTEEEYYRGFAEKFHTFAIIGGVMALIITLGGIMVGMNTMYTAISGRTREIGMLQVLGFSKRSILWSFLLESLLIALVGGLLGCAIGTLVNGVPMQITMGVFLFRVDAVVLGSGLGLALLIGVLGALIPAIRAIRIPKVEAMRYM